MGCNGKDAAQHQLAVWRDKTHGDAIMHAAEKGVRLLNVHQITLKINYGYTAILRRYTPSRLS